MGLQKIFIDNTIIRATALWAASEAFLGGVLYALKIPMSGAFLAAFASICITIIALFSKGSGVILKATIVVISIKFLLSPHSPIMAYLAVAIQGIAGELFFIRRKNLMLSAFAISIFSLVYSAFQHLIVLTVLFGISFWKALDVFLNKIAHNFGVENIHYLSYIIIVYMGIYLLSGILAGILNIHIVKSISNKLIPEYVSRANELKTQSLIISTKKRKSNKRILFPLAVFSSFFLMTSYTTYFENVLSSYKLLLILIRSLLIVAVWLLVISPLLKKWISKLLQKKNIRQSDYFKSVVQLLPEMRLVIQKSWEVAKAPNIFIRVKRFLMSCFLLVLFYD